MHVAPADVLDLVDLGRSPEHGSRLGLDRLALAVPVAQAHLATAQHDGQVLGMGVATLAAHGEPGLGVVLDHAQLVVLEEHAVRAWIELHRIWRGVPQRRARSHRGEQPQQHASVHFPALVRHASSPGYICLKRWTYDSLTGRASSRWRRRSVTRPPMSRITISIALTFT